MGAFTRLLRGSYVRVSPGTQQGLGRIRDKRQWRRYLKAQYGRHWKILFTKHTWEAGHSVKYLSTLPETAADVGFMAVTLRWRRGGPPLTRSPRGKAYTPDADTGRDERELYQPHSDALRMTVRENLNEKEDIG